MEPCFSLSELLYKDCTIHILTLYFAFNLSKSKYKSTNFNLTIQIAS